MSKTFVLPVIIFTILYNVPKFFELYVKEEVIEKTLNCTEVLSDSNYEDHHENCTLYDNYNVTVPDLDENQNLRFVSLHHLVTKDQKLSWVINGR